MELTAREKAWLKRVQKALDACPSPDRFGFYTIGDNEVTVYDAHIVTDEVADESVKDFCVIVNENDAYIDSLNFPMQVHSTAG